VHTARLLTHRSLDALVRSALCARVEGFVVMRDRDGLRHGVWVQAGYLVGAHVAGSFDPLLELLVRQGVLDRGAQRRCLRALAQHGERAGGVARALAGVTAGALSDALKLQIAERYAALQAIAGSTGYDARFEAGRVPGDEQSVRLPLGSLLRRVARLAETPRESLRGADTKPGQAAQSTTLPPRETASPTPSPAARQAAQAEQGAARRDDARRHLRTLAKSLHPDLHASLDEESRQRLSLELARATAHYHGFG
jgi:hypothetical protein